MALPQAFSMPSSSKRQNRFPKKSWSSKKTLNISRKILEKSSVQQNKRIDSIQQNNVQLARKVSELQKELSERTAELQLSREDAFELQMKLNRLHNSNAESALHALREKLTSVMEEMFKTHEFVSRVCDELSLPEVSPTPSISLSSNTSVRSVPQVSPVIAVSAEVNQMSLDDATLRPSVQSVEMELDSFVRSSGSRSIDGKAVPASPHDDKVAVTTPVPARKSSPLPRSTSLCPDDDDEDYFPSPKPKRKRVAAVRKAAKTSKVSFATTATMADSIALSEVVRSLDSASGHRLEELNPLPTPVIFRSASAEQAKAGLGREEEKKKLEFEEPNLPKPKFQLKRQSEKKRKRLRLIADDSVFIPISDSMVEDAMEGNKENIVKTVPLLAEQKDNRIEGIVEIAEVKPRKPKSAMRRNRSSGGTKTLSSGRTNSDFEADVKRAASMEAKGSSELMKSPTRVRRRAGSVSYVVKLNTKLRQGDQDWCKR